MKIKRFLLYLISLAMIQLACGIATQPEQPPAYLETQTAEAPSVGPPTEHPTPISDFTISTPTQETAPTAVAWIQIGGPAAAIYAGGNELFATNPDSGDIYRYNGSPFDWTKVGGPGLTFAVNGLGELFGISPDGGGVFYWTGTPEHWTQIGGPAAAIYAGGNELFATNPDSGDIYRYNGSPFDWTKVGGPGLTFAVNGLGELFGTSPDGGGVFYWTGTPEQWTQIGGPAAAIYAGGNELFATNPDSGDIYRYNGSPFDWTKVGGPGLTFAVNGLGELFGISPDGGGVFYWTGTPEQWTQIGGPAGNIFSGRSEGVCATNPDSRDVWCYK